MKYVNRKRREECKLISSRQTSLEYFIISGRSVNFAPVFFTGVIGLGWRIVVTVISDTGKLDWLKGSCEDKRMEIDSVHYNVTSLCFIQYKLLLAWYDSLSHFPCHST